MASVEPSITLGPPIDEPRDVIPETDAVVHARPIRFAAMSAHVVGAIVAMACAFAFDTYVRVRDLGAGLTLDRLSRLEAYAHAFALALPFALAYTLVLALVERMAPVPMRRIGRLFSIRNLLSADPETFAFTFSSLAGIAIAAVGVSLVARRLLDTLHSHILIAVGIGVAGPFVVAIGSRFAELVERPLRAFARGLDRAASPVVALAVLAIFVLAAIYRFAEVAPMLDRAISWTAVRTASIFAIVELAVASTLSREGAAARRMRVVSLLAFVLGIAASTTSILVYGRTTSQRFFVEEVSLSGSLAYRFWSEILDRDGDGYPSLLGGRDCDDSRRDIHPGAVDVPGDGRDTDCFGGDGTPRFDDRAVMVLRSAGGHLATPNILLVSIDTMRPDRLAIEGERRHVAPRLDAFAREAVVFRQAEASSPRTTRSMPAIFTGDDPASLPYDREFDRLDLSRSADTLAERLAPRFETAAILGTNYFMTIPNLLQGFGVVEHAGPVKPDPAWTTDRAITWLTAGRTSPKPFFLWAHYFAPHEPYLVDEFPSRFGDSVAGQYDTEVWRADREVGRLLDHLASRGLDRNTIVVVFSDHGESLGEHGTLGHSTRLTEEQIHSVLMIRAPGYPARVVDTPVALYDLHPTLLDFAGMPSYTPMSARNLVGLMRGSDVGFVGRPLFAEILPDAVYAIETEAVRIGREKLIFFPRTGRMALYDLANDPGELRDLADVRRARANELRTLLLEWEATSHRSENRVAQRIADAEVRAIPVGVSLVDARFANGITLVGAAIANPEVSVDGVMRVDLYFRAERPITDDYLIHLDFVPENPTITGSVFSAHHTAIDGSYPSSLWRPGRMFRDTVVLRVPHAARRGEAYVCNLELWRDFHLRSPSPVDHAGATGESVRFGHFTVR